VGLARIGRDPAKDPFRNLISLSRYPSPILLERGGEGRERRRETEKGSGAEADIL